ncbi:MAG: hypothetical protein AB8G17_01145 [Gammaproteobacteria bacterium]
MNQKLLVPTIGGVLLCAALITFFHSKSPPQTADAQVETRQEAPVAKSLDDVLLPSPITQTAPVLPPAPEEPDERPVTAKSYNERILDAGWGNEHSELYNSSFRTLRGYVEQYFAGSIQDREFIGNAAWQLTMRVAPSMNGKPITVDLPAFVNTAKYAVLSATLLDDSAPIRHLLTTYMSTVGEEEAALALAEWAVDHFDDASTPLLYEFIEVRYRAVDRQNRDLDRQSVARGRTKLEDYIERARRAVPSLAEGTDNG